MNIPNDIKPVAYLKSRAADLLNQINETSGLDINNIIVRLFKLKLISKS